MSLPILNVLIPHYCCSCGRIGAVLCEYCKYDIVSEPFEQCVVCLKPASSLMQLCGSCAAPYSRAWCVGARMEALKATINLYKYDSVRAAVSPLLDLLDQQVPRLDEDTCIVPVPTIAPHVRTRGYDHTALLARQFAKRRGLRYTPVLARRDNTRQQGSSRRQRLLQAQKAFACRDIAPRTYLLIDDVFTTGATLHYATKTLRDAGARDVYVAVLARQPLEKA